MLDPRGDSAFDAESQSASVVSGQSEFPDDERTPRVCTNHGCQAKFTLEDNAVCYSHFGVWDFGHTGISIEQSLREIQSGQFETILWPPHWTCCGRGWRDSCGKKHVHSGVSEHSYAGRGADFDIEKQLESQMKFKKIIRGSWIAQVNKFHKFDRSAVKRRIQKFADENRFKKEVGSACN